MKKRIFSIIVYLANLILLCCPWIPLGQVRYNYFSFSAIAWANDFQNEIIDAAVATENITNLIVGTRAELVALGISVLLSGIYLTFTVFGKYRKLNFVNMFCLLCVLIMHSSGETLANFCNSDLLGALVPSLLFLLSLVECIFRYIIMDWDKIKSEVRKNKEREAEIKAEEKKRLDFQGKYSRQFYRILLKNFWGNCKDFVLLLFCNVVLFSFFVVGLGLKQYLAAENTSKGTLIFDGLGQILVNAMVPMVIISGTVIIILLFYYLKCRAKGYGLFMTLGMRKGLFYSFMATELSLCLLLSMVLGSLAGKVLMNIFFRNSKEIMGISFTTTSVGVLPYIQAAGIMLGVYILLLMTARDVFIDFNIGKSADIQAIAEPMPGRFCNIVLLMGIMSMGYCMLRYSKRYNFENTKLIFVLFLVFFIVVRYALANYLMREREKKSYLRNLLIHNQLIHKIKTNAGYIAVLAVIQFCVLFYFSFQIFSVLITDEPERLFPYDFVCLADTADDEFFKRLEEKYDTRIYEYPIVRVSAYDSTEQNESVIHQGNPIQGQHIGISESTYHALKNMLDKTYEPKDLGLDKNGKNIYIVYQQDQSVKAQPTAFWIPRKKPLLHIGLPCVAVSITSLHQIDIGYEYYEIEGEEIGSLIGNFKQGTRENLIVFSDEYFEKIKEQWKTTNIITGEKIENEEERIENLTIYQGVTKIVLLKADKKDVANIEREKIAFEKSHLQKEAEAYVIAGGVYDKSVSYCYSKAEAVKNISTERYMKIVMNILVVLIFWFMYMMLIVIKMLSEKEMNCRRLSFLTCMGMRKRDRIKLIIKELITYYYCLPTGMAGLLSGIFMFIVFEARLFSITDIRNYLAYYIPVAVTYLLIATIVFGGMVSMYAKYVETAQSSTSI